MASSGGAPVVPQGEETPAKVTGSEKTLGVKVESTLQTANGGSSVPDQEKHSASGKNLERATELFNMGSKAIEDGDYFDAVDCLSRALEIRVAHYGELAPECAISYYKYGCALLYKSQEEADPLVNVPKNTPKGPEKDKAPNNMGDSGSLKASTSNPKDCTASSTNEDVEDGASDKDQEDDTEGSDGEGEELAEALEDDSDLDLAWKMLDVARAIVEKCPEDKIEKVNILAALGEVSMEREDFETSLNDYLKALSIMERLVEPDNRRLVELNFRICLVMEVASKVEEAIPYCQKAISLCKSRLKLLTEDVKLTVLPQNNVSPATDSDIGVDRTSVKGDADLIAEDEKEVIAEDEKEVLGGILSELERKLEDLQQVMPNPKSIFSEFLKIVASKSASAETNLSSTDSRSASLNSSQMAVVNGGFDSPTITTAASNGAGVTHLGVVGRGVKRATLNPIAVEPSQKKHLLDSAEKEGSSTPEVVDSTAQDVETPME